jgi:Zn-finger nucleic acid-binding protein
MALSCPQCAAAMNEVAASAAVGYSIVLDQCPRCGGIWCDRWELYPLTAAAAEHLDPVDQAALVRPAATRSEPLECPRCRARMRRFRDPSLPPDARIERCPNCDGMWLNRGELRRFKHRDVLDNTTRRPTEAQLDQLAQATSPPAAVRHLADAFTTTHATADDADVRREILTGAAWLIARTALRLLLHL